jgi:hypothetical protein
MIDYVKETKVFWGIHRFILHIPQHFFVLSFVLFITIESTHTQNTRTIYDTQNLKLDKNYYDVVILLKKLRLNFSYIEGF